MNIKEVMLLKRLLPACFALFMTACAQVEVADLPSGELVVGSGEGVDSIKLAEQAVVEKKTAIAPSLLFSLLGGEIAGQRGHVVVASELYLRAAQQSQDSQVALRAAQVALYSQNFSAAKIAVDIFLQGENIDRESRQLALIVYLRTGAVNESLDQINYLLELEPSSKRAVFLAIGDVIVRNASKPVGLKVINKMLQNNPQRASVLLIYSQYWLSADQLETALNYANKAIDLDPQWELPYLLRANILDKKGDSAEAREVLRVASERFKSVPIMMGYAKLLLQQGQLDQAKEQFLAVLVIDEQAARARFSLALVHLKLNEVVEAEAILKDLYAKKIFSGKAAFYLGKINYFRKDFKQAAEWFERVSSGTNYIEAQLNISNIKYQSGDIGGAVSVVRQLREVAPSESVRLYLLEADLLLSEDNYAALFELMNEAVKKEPEHLKLRYMRAIAAAEMQDHVLAEKDLKLVLAKDPVNVNALNALGYMLASETFRFTDARKYLSQALALKPKDAAILDSMGWLEYREGRYEESFALLTTAYKKSPEGEIAAHLGEVLWMLGRKNEASKLWEEALQRAPQNKYLLEIFERFK